MKRTIMVIALVSWTWGVGGVPAGAAADATPPVGVKGGAAPAGAAAAPAGKEEMPAAAEEASLVIRMPLFSERFSRTPVAVVNEDPILLEELTGTLASLHEQQQDSKKARKKNFTTVLNRLINVRLILQEAANMGLDDSPQVKKVVDEYAATTLKDHLKLAHVKDVKPDEKILEQLYRELVKEWKIKSIKFEKEEDAKALAAELKAGGSFDELTARLVAEKKGEGSPEGTFLKPDALLPEVAQVVSAMTVGATSPVVAVGPAFTIFKLEEIGYPDNPEARETARRQAIDLKRAALIREYFKTLTKKYATIDEKLLKTVDYEAAKPGFKKLLKDKRVIARIKGEKPITVGDLAEAISDKFYHGMEAAIREKKINDRKHPTLDEMLYDRIFRMEALKQGIDKTEDYRKGVKEYRETIVFGTFIEKVVTPEIKVTEGELADYYKEHLDEFSSPEMIKLKSLAFTRKQHAEAALEKLRKGADFLWLKANAEGQAVQGTDSFLEFDGNTLVSRNLPDSVRSAVAGAKQGDLKLHASPEGFFYVLAVVDVIPAKPAPLEGERKNIVKKVFGTKLNKAVEEWGDKLRSAYPVKIYITDYTR